MENNNRLLHMRNIVNYFVHKYNGNWDNAYDAIQDKEKVELVDLNSFIMEKANTNVITIVDDDYPKNYKNIYMPPFTIYYEGDKSIIQNEKNISLFGNVDEKNFEDIANKNTVYTIELNDSNLELAKKYSKEGIKFAILSDKPFDNKLAKDLKGFENIFYGSEVPAGSKKNCANQKFERMLIGCSKDSVFFNENNNEFEKYKDISLFEKRKMNVVGNYNKDYLGFAKPFEPKKEAKSGLEFKVYSFKKDEVETINEDQLVSKIASKGQTH